MSAAARADPGPPTDRPRAEPGGLRSPERAHLRAYAEASAPGTLVPVPREWLLRLLEGCEHTDPPAAGEVSADRTVREAAAVLRLSQTRTRALIAAGKLAAYRIGGTGGLRIRADALDAFRRPAPPPTAPDDDPGPRADLGRWRDVVPHPNGGPNR